MMAGMQMTTVLSAPSTEARSEADRSVVPRLQRSGIFQDYRKAFESTTGLPLALRAVGSFQSPLQGSKRANPFCTLMAAGNKSCASCLQLQQRVETEATSEPKTLECFAGLSESAIPIHAGGQVLGYLQTGQVFMQAPSKARFKRLSRQLAQWGIAPANLHQLETAYFQTRVVAKKQYESIVRLLGIFAQHLASLSNQVLVTEAQAELPAITRARSFIAEKQSDAISLADVARVANMSAFYFCKIFKKATGLTFTDYLARVRVETVKKMLLNPHTRMSEAAYAAGFQSLSQFNRVFHRIAGEPPSRYHQRIHHTTRSLSGPFSLAHAA
jgi:AraC-like DNA-binding protein/ligand-binding sensor protein